MTTIELNAELYRAMSEIADDRDSLEKVLAFVKTLVPPKKKRRKSNFLNCNASKKIRFTPII